MAQNHRFFHPLLVPTGVLAVTMMAGCAGGGYGRGDNFGPVPGYDRETARQAHEQDLERRVMAALSADPRVGAADLKVQSQGDGVVMISGSPANGIAGRTLALRIAQQVPGVRSVINNMTMN